jgi:hypothetical protein
MNLAGHVWLQIVHHGKTSIRYYSSCHKVQEKSLHCNVILTHLENVIIALLLLVSLASFFADTSPYRFTPSSLM